MGRLLLMDGQKGRLTNFFLRTWVIAFLIAAASPILAQVPRAQVPPAPVPELQPTIQALASSFPGEKGRVRVALWFGITSDALEVGPLEATARLIERGVEVEAFAIEATLDAETLEGRNRLQFYGDLSAQPGEYVLVLEISVGILAARAEFPFTIKALQMDRPTVMPPFFLDDEGAVAAFFESAATISAGSDEPGEEALDEGEPPADYPLVASGERFIPDISPRITPDMPRSRICLIGTRLTDDQTFLETGLISQDGTLLSKERLAVISQDGGQEEAEPQAETGNLETLCLGLDTQGLEAGIYQLNVTLHDFERRKTESTELPFEILDGEILD